MKSLANRYYLHVIKLVKSTAYHIYFYKLTHKQFDGLHLGSGDAKIENFCNIDASLYSLCDIVARVETLKLSSDSVGIIYNSHVFEHIPMAHAKRVLAEWYRVLRLGGRLYICVPDLEVLFKVYLDNLPFYETEKGKYLVDRACFLTYGAQRNKYDFHFYGYSFITLKDMLESVGFKDVKRFDRSKLDIVPFNDSSSVKVDDFLMSLNVEATK